jgi:hypothetical protein
MTFVAQALVSFKKYMPPPLSYFKVNICPLPLPIHFDIFIHSYAPSIATGFPVHSIFL